MQEINSEIDDALITFPVEVVQETVSDRVSLVTFILDPQSQNIWAMTIQLPRLRVFVDGYVGRIMGSNKVQIGSAMVTMNLLLYRGPWFFAEWMVTVHHWSITVQNLSKEFWRKTSSKFKIRSGLCKYRRREDILSSVIIHGDSQLQGYERGT
ncbi:unnamed protein product [Arabidopsis lyrata]|nr:unnamed protein product [Arabidopsis lyrata]